MIEAESKITTLAKREKQSREVKTIDALSVRITTLTQEVPVPQIPEHIQWLIDHYTPPRELLMDTGSLVPNGGDPMIEAAAKQYNIRKREESFIEWLFHEFPPEPVRRRED